ncbi:MAG: 16S rRNA (guanine(966)-N(2))-methyltransferase RsmD [Burkholderiaceae bacterium]
MRAKKENGFASGKAPKRSQGPSLSTAPRPAGQVRIIGGQWKRTPIAVPDKPGLRPSGDRVRETVFNWLGHLVGDFGAVRGLDMFAGSGALGFELASRGSRRVVLIERDAQLARALRALKDKLKADAIEVMQADALAAAARLPAEFDLIFLDPPFAAGIEAKALTAAIKVLAPDGLIYLESPAVFSAEAAAAAGLEIVRQGQAGRVAFHLLRCAKP